MLNPPSFESLEARRLLSGGTINLQFGEAGLGATGIGGPPAAIVPTSHGGVLVGQTGQLGGLGITQFDAAGHSTLEFGDDTATTLNTMSLQSDGSLFTLSENTTSLTLNNTTSLGDSLTLDHFNAQGQLEGSFGNGGRVTLAVSDLDEQGAQIYTYRNGSLLVLAQRPFQIVKKNQQRGYVWQLFRINANGTLDTNFGAGGMTEFVASNGNLPVTPSKSDLVMNVAADGSISVIGSMGKVATFDRYGSLLAVNTFANNPATTWGLLPDGQGDFYVLSGNDNSNYLPGMDGSPTDPSVSHYLSNLSLDTSFGDDGTATAPLGALPGEGYFNTGEVLSDGSLILGGQFGGLSTQSVVASLSSTGQFDSTFGNNGVVLTDLNPGGPSTVTGLTTTSNGQIVLTDAGYQNVYLQSLYLDTGSAPPTAQISQFSSPVPDSIDWSVSVDYSSAAGFNPHSFTGAEVQLVSIAGEGSPLVSVPLVSVRAHALGGGNYRVVYTFHAAGRWHISPVPEVFYTLKIKPDLVYDLAGQPVAGGDLGVQLVENVD